MLMTPGKINKIDFNLAERLCKKCDVLGARHPKDTPQDIRLGSSGVGKAVWVPEQWGKWLRLLGKREMTLQQFRGS